VKYTVKKLWQELPTIHKYWGFSGGFDKQGVFFDEVTKKITIINWDRAQLPITHIIYSDGSRKNAFMPFQSSYKVYSKRLINGFGTPDSMLAVDKEALCCCLLECRQASRLQQ
jgi:hypothetical protein